MPTAEQVKALIKSHFDDDAERFLTISMQLAAHEARQGHASAAADIRNLIDQAKERRAGFKVVSFNHDFDDLLFVSEAHNKLAELVMPALLRQRIDLSYSFSHLLPC